MMNERLIYERTRKKIWMIEENALLERKAIAKKEKRMETKGAICNYEKCKMLWHFCLCILKIMVPVINIRWNSNFYTVFDISMQMLCLWIAQKFISFFINFFRWHTFELNRFHGSLNASISVVHVVILLNCLLNSRH